MVLLLSMAFAHAPHDVVRGFAAPYDLSESHTWWVTGSRSGVLFNYSYNAGDIWYTSSAPDSTTPIDMCMMEDGTTISGTSVRYYYSSDDGLSFSHENGPASTADIACGDHLWIAAPAGLYGTDDPATAPTVYVAGSFARVVAFLDQAAALDSDGYPYVWDGSTWTVRSRPEGLPAAAVSADGNYVGTTAGKVYSWNSSSSRWEQCATLPSESTGEPQIQVITVDGFTGSTLLVGASYGGPYASTDLCQTWTSPLMGEQPYVGVGGPSATTPTWSEMFAYNNRWVLTGWAGVWVSDNSGLVWTEGNWFTAGAEPTSSITSADTGDTGTPEDPLQDCTYGASPAVLLLPLLGGLRRGRA